MTQAAPTEAPHVPPVGALTSGDLVCEGVGVEDAERDTELVRLAEKDMLDDFDGLNDRLDVAEEPSVAVLVSDRDDDEDNDEEDVLESDRDVETVELGDAV